MNIVEALQSDKPIKRVQWDIWITGIKNSTGKLEWSSMASQSWGLDRADLLADDWEIQQVAVSITSAQFWAAYANQLTHLGSEYGAHGYCKDLIIGMARKLGLDK